MKNSENLFFSFSFLPNICKTAALIKFLGVKEKRGAFFLSDQEVFPKISSIYNQLIPYWEKHAAEIFLASTIIILFHFKRKLFNGLVHNGTFILQPLNTKFAMIRMKT